MSKICSSHNLLVLEDLVYEYEKHCAALTILLPNVEEENPPAQCFQLLDERVDMIKQHCARMRVFFHCLHEETNVCFDNYVGS